MHAAHAPDHVEPNETPLDSWHRHTADEGLPREEHGAHANVVLLLVIFAVLFLATLVFSLAIGVFTMREFSQAKAEGERAGLDARLEVVQRYRQDAKAEQAGYGWTEQGTVRMPIERAMDLVVRDHGG